MASLRQAAIDAEALELFVAMLEGEDMRAFQVAMATLAEEPRREGEPAFPSLGMMLELIDEASEIFPAAPDQSIDRLPVYEADEAKALR